MLTVTINNFKAADVPVQRKCGGLGTGSAIANTMLIVRYISHSPSCLYIMADLLSPLGAIVCDTKIECHYDWKE